ncbi:tyrosine-type recombinase/integrase [Lysinibacillus halotolerans]|uniref:Site-specific integrase n=1 Tax=Lysinibacillus halotolerans TaxID=1368476 RepID=A0A3M8H888_9BACI|nr:tyrosine-type recombinase/integrase [Lysinibacillus halotolerans]RNC98499.1 site-specific integrase [Lysinibacillus halotolerans]
MASFTKRGNTWQYAISRTIDGKQKPIRKGGFRTKKEAQEAALQMEFDLKNGVLDPQKDYPIEKYFLEWFKTYKRDISDITLNSYKATHTKLLNYFGDKAIQSITKREYQQFLNDMGEQFAKTTNRKMNGFIRTCIREAIDEGLIKTDFTRNVTITGAASKKSSEKFLDYDASQLLLKYLHANIDNGLEYTMLIVALTSGLRYGELVGLSIEDINFKESTVKIHRQWRYKEYGGFGPLKNESSERTIGLDKTTMNVLKKQVLKVSNHPQNENRLVFYTSDSPIQVITNDRLNDVLRASIKKLKIKPIITVHGLRHTHASVLLYQDISVLYVSERLGHASIDITTSTYAHLLKELRERDSSKTASIFEDLLTYSG